MESTQKNQKRTFSGAVVSVGMDKTIVVKVDRVKNHPKYHKQYVQSKKYHVHAANGAHQIGDTVTFVGCRPLSKTKRWRTVSV